MDNDDGRPFRREVSVLGRAARQTGLVVLLAFRVIRLARQSNPRAAVAVHR